jgi:site-specific recombinase XerD
MKIRGAITTFSVVNAKVISDSSGSSIPMRVLIWADGVSRPLIDYYLSIDRSLSWQETLLRAAKLFLEYMQVNASLGQTEFELFRNFGNALRNGTIDVKTREDPSGLYWDGINVNQANRMISQLSDFFDWLGPDKSTIAEKFNPHYSGNPYDQQLDLQAYRYRRNKAFLGYSWSTKPKSQARRLRGKKIPKVFETRPPMFPEDHFEELLFKGFRVAGKHDYRGMLITLLMFGGGLRVSEPFHLYIADVQPHWEDPSKAFVAVHHPSLGSAPNGWENRSGKRGVRKEYLAAQFGLLPRDDVLGKSHAGWKNPALDAKWYMQVHWLPEVYGEWYMQIWIRYMEQIAMIPRNHPYAWVNIDREPIGQIYTMGQYQKALQAAVERIGLTFGKKYGTTAHGCRHAYAQRASKGGIDPIIIQRVLHHCSLESQQIYTQPEAKDTQLAIRKATTFLRENSTQFPALLPVSELSFKD